MKFSWESRGGGQIRSGFWQIAWPDRGQPPLVRENESERLQGLYEAQFLDEEEMGREGSLLIFLILLL